jgi:hypothetical protein
MQSLGGSGTKRCAQELQSLGAALTGENRGVHDSTQSMNRAAPQAPSDPARERFGLVIAALEPSTPVKRNWDDILGVDRAQRFPARVDQ